MAKNAPGKHYRIGISLVDAVKRFSDEVEAERLFVDARWPDGVRCVKCDSANVSPRPTRKPAPFRCNDCRFDFSVKVGTVMEGSNLSLSKWAIAAYLMTTNLKGVSSMKLHRDLGITQKTAWHLAHRIRKAWECNTGFFGGPVEARRDVCRRQGKEQAPREAQERGERNGRQGSGRWRQRPHHGPSERRRCAADEQADA